MTTDVQTGRGKPTAERYSTGKPRVKMAKEDDSSAPPPETKKGCYICGTIQRGDSYTSLPDEKGIGRVIHTPIHAEDGKSVDRNTGCLGEFISRVAAANKQAVREQQEDLALASLRREGGNIPRLEHLSQRRFDCTIGDCSRFFDSENGRDLHLRRGHKATIE